VGSVRLPNIWLNTVYLPYIAVLKNFIPLPYQKVRYTNVRHTVIFVLKSPGFIHGSNQRTRSIYPDPPECAPQLYSCTRDFFITLLSFNFINIWELTSNDSIDVVYGEIVETKKDLSPAGNDDVKSPCVFSLSLITCHFISPQGILRRRKPRISRCKGVSIVIKIMEQTTEKKFPLNAKDYKLYEEVGEGVSATVYRALCIPLDVIVAIKVLDLEKCNNDLDGIRREVQTLLLIDHPNVLRAHCSFTTEHNLWVVTPYMDGGSCLHIIKSDYPDGFEEPVIATILHEVLKALVYLHAHGHIHRDVKAGNILIDSDGTVKLADFGVAACMFDTGDRQRSRNTFVGTPCWMAPEVMQQLHGYDFKADIWSFGITALELAHGHAPFSKYPPMKVLLMTLQNAPPGLDYERDKRFSKAKEADLLVRNKALYEDKEHLSQQEYIRGISAWNFNLEDLKNQAALDELDGIDDLESSLADFPIKPLQALKGCFDVCEDDIGSPISRDSTHSDTEQQSEQQPSRIAMERESGTDEESGRIGTIPYFVPAEQEKVSSGFMLQDNVLSAKKFSGDVD
ncbi:hypothetical protein MIMGU_mgv11b021090mg, partial [Erythranthe guttata]